MTFVVGTSDITNNCDTQAKYLVVKRVQQSDLYDVNYGVTVRR